MKLPYNARAIETRWRSAWHRARCFRAPRQPGSARFFNYDSGPFPSGDLHMGHVRTYVLGDLTARYQRLLGRSVLYCTEFDAFGLPNELAAIEAGVSPGDYTRECIGRMRRQLIRLGISYDWSRVATTCDPAYYSRTQRLFLELYRRGLVERREAELNWCPRCETALARMQVDKGRCWRCATPVEKRLFPQWFIQISRFSERLRAGLDELGEWSQRSTRLLSSFIGDGRGSETETGYRVHDWLVSRQRAWGTPIPIVHCDRCGQVPVPPEQLPVRLPDELDWSLGARALAECGAFVVTSCPGCGAAARRETDTLDCFFDDIWCFMACTTPPGGSFRFENAELDAWLPVDRFHSGFDTFYYLHLHRFLGLILHEWGLLSDPEPIRSYMGHDMVLSGGRKMSKHLGNAVSPVAVLDRYGADVLRVAILWAAGPERTLAWHDGLLERAAQFLGRAYALFELCHSQVSEAGEGGGPEGPVADESGSGPAVVGGAREAAAAASSGAGRSLALDAAEAFSEVARWIDAYRPNAAVERLADLLARIERYARRRVRTGRLAPGDRRVLSGALGDFAIALSPFAPHLAEELWRQVGGRRFVCRQRWPRVTASQPPRPASHSSG